MFLCRLSVSWDQTDWLRAGSRGLSTSHRVYIHACIIRTTQKRLPEVPLWVTRLYMCVAKTRGQGTVFRKRDRMMRRRVEPNSHRTIESPVWSDAGTEWEKETDCRISFSSHRRSRRETENRKRNANLRQKITQTLTPFSPLIGLLLSPSLRCPLLLSLSSLQTKSSEI